MPQSIVNFQPVFVLAARAKNVDGSVILKTNWEGDSEKIRT